MLRKSFFFAIFVSWHCKHGCHVLKQNVMIRETSTDDGIRKIADMADPIWHEAFAGIISKEQIEYMIDKFQSYNAIKDQVDNHGYRYFILSEDGTDAGYCGVQVAEDNSLYLSKMYLKKDFRGHGLFREMTAYLTELCRREGIGRIWLTVNKNNDGAIAAYQATGYRNIKSQVTDIGSGYVMDDYVFELNVQDA